jgi:hypothetical protein
MTLLGHDFQLLSSASQPDSSCHLSIPAKSLHILGNLNPEHLLYIAQIAKGL